MLDLAPYPRSESDATSETTEDTSSADVTSRTPEMDERLPDEPEESTDVGEKNDVTHGRPFCHNNKFWSSFIVQKNKVLYDIWKVPTSEGKISLVLLCQRSLLPPLAPLG